MEKLKEFGERTSWKIFFKGIILALIISLVLTWLLAIIVNSVNISDSIIDFMIMFISGFSILISAFISGKKIKKNGIFIGSVIGISYIFILYIISSIINMNFMITIKFLEIIGIAFIFGIIGGIVGVNLK